MPWPPLLRLRQPSLQKIQGPRTSGITSNARAPIASIMIAISYASSTVRQSNFRAVKGNGGDGGIAQKCVRKIDGRGGSLAPSSKPTDNGSRSSFTRTGGRCHHARRSNQSLRNPIICCCIASKPVTASSSSEAARSLFAASIPGKVFSFNLAMVLLWAASICSLRRRYQAIIFCPKIAEQILNSKKTHFTFDRLKRS